MGLCLQTENQILQFCGSATERPCDLSMSIRTIRRLRQCLWRNQTAFRVCLAVCLFANVLLLFNFIYSLNSRQIEAEREKIKSHRLCIEVYFPNA